MKYIDLHMDVASYAMSGARRQLSIRAINKLVSFFVASVFVEPERPSVEIDEQIAWYTRNRTIITTPFLIHIEGLGALSPHTFWMIERWRDAEVRSAGLVWNTRNAIGYPATSGLDSPGLSRFGKRVVRELDRLGMHTDCAHLSRAGFYDVLRLATRPPFISHANAYRLCPNPRNITDDQIRNLSRAGGIIGVFFSGKFVRADGEPTVKDVCNHIEHIAEVGGLESVAIGSDFGGITSGHVRGLASVREIENLRVALASRGWGAKDIERVFSSNALDYLPPLSGNST